MNKAHLCILIFLVGCASPPPPDPQRDFSQTPISQVLNKAVAECAEENGEITSQTASQMMCSFPVSIGYSGLTALALGGGASVNNELATVKITVFQNNSGDTIAIGSSYVSGILAQNGEAVEDKQWPDNRLVSATNFLNGL